MKNEKQIDVNIATVIPSTRQTASFIGGLLGKAYSTVESRDCWQGGAEGFENDKKAAATPGIASLVTNRSPKKYLLRTQDIISAQFHKQGLTGQTGIAINLRPDETCDLFFPLDGTNPVVTEKPMGDAISAALRGEGDNFFMDAEKVAAVLNEANKAEVKNIETLINALSKMKQNIQGAIIENEKKAAEISKQWIDSKMEGIDIKDVLTGNATSVINVHTANE